MATTKVRMFLVTPGDPSKVLPPEEIEALLVPVSGDAAKRAAKDAVAEMGYKLRSLNWTPGKSPTLLAYVMRKG